MLILEINLACDSLGKMITMYSRYSCVSKRIQIHRYCVSTVSSYLLLCDSDHYRNLLILGCSRISHFLWKNLRLHSYISIFLSINNLKQRIAAMIVFAWVQAAICQDLLHFLWASCFTLVYFIAESAVWVLQPKLSSLLKLFMQLYDLSCIKN